MTVLRAFLATLMLGGTLGLAACDDAEGPAEQAGEAVDEAAEDTKRAVDDASD